MTTDERGLRERVEAICDFLPPEYVDRFLGLVREAEDEARDELREWLEGATEQDNLVQQAMREAGERADREKERADRLEEECSSAHADVSWAWAALRETRARADAAVKRAEEIAAVARSDAEGMEQDNAALRKRVRELEQIVLDVHIELRDSVPGQVRINGLRVVSEPAHAIRPERESLDA